MTENADYNYLETSLGNIHFHKFGIGEKVMICFHGFGQDGSVMQPFAEALGRDYTCYSFDLFYHGHTYWLSKENPVEKEFWRSALKKFLSEKKIKTFSIAAFSLGGKLALVTVNQFAEMVDQLIFLAPDGIKTQMWYNLATYPGFFQKYFKSIIVKPHRFHRVISLLKATKTVDKGILKFAKTQMNTVKKRRQVYYSWIAFKKLTTDIPGVAKKINKFNIEVSMYLGAYDKIITEEGMATLTSLLKKVEVIKLNCGHNTLINHAAKHIRELQ